MARNSYFLQGSESEQRLVQDLINEQLKIYGLDITYIPRKFVNTQSIIEEVQSSKFDDNFVLEAYVNSYDGYSGAGDVLTKFGMSLRDEVELTISKERFEDFISPFMSASDNIDLASRPREGDLVFFPLGQRLFEVKFVEHEEPFYQLGKNYVYKLKCELFEYENEVIDTSIDAIDTQVQEEGYISTLQLVGVGRTATATVSLGTGYIREIFLNNDGSGFTGTPVVSISTSPSGLAGDNATAVAVTTERAGVRSIEKILMTNTGANYNTPPIITITGGGGTGAAATCSIETSAQGVLRFTMTDNGVGFGTVPTVTVSNPAGELLQIRRLVLLLWVLIVEDLMRLNQYLYRMQERDIHFNPQLQYLTQKQSMVLVTLNSMKLFRECVQELKQESKIGMLIQTYFLLQTLVLEEQLQDSLLEKM